MGWVVRRGARGVADQGRDVDLYEGQVVQVKTPSPDACVVLVVLGWEAAQS